MEEIPPQLYERGYVLYDLNQCFEVVAKALSRHGWNFASQSYTHNRQNYFGPNSQPANIARDTRK